MTDERIGQQIGNYRLMRLIGQGGFADVYLGEHVDLREQAAIKVLYTRLTDELRENFLNEARLLARLNHPHIVHTLEFGLETNGVPYLVMDYASQGTVRQRHPSSSKVPLSTVVGYVLQVAAALQYAHDQKLIHRDLKPDNLLIGSHNGLLLSDFGVAIISQTTTRSQTHEKSIAGTMAYMAPEQLQGKAQRASDQYSLGIIVYEWLCGTRPFHGTVIEVFTQHVSMRPAPLRDHAPELSPTIEQVVLKALEKDPAQRFASVSEFAEAFAQASRGEIPAFISERTLHPQTGLPDLAALSESSQHVSRSLTLPGPAPVQIPPAFAAQQAGSAAACLTPATPSRTTAPDIQNSLASGAYPMLTLPANITPSGNYASAPGASLPPTQLAPRDSVSFSSGSYAPAQDTPSSVYVPPTQFAPSSGYTPPTQAAPPADYLPPAQFASSPAYTPPAQLSPFATPASNFAAPMPPLALSGGSGVAGIDRPVPPVRSTGKIILLVALIALVILGGTSAAIYSLTRAGAGSQGHQGIAGTQSGGGQGNVSGNPTSSSGGTGSGNSGTNNNGSNPNNNGSNKSGSGGSTPQPTSTSNSPGPTATTAPRPTATSAPKPTATPTPKPPPGCTVYTDWTLHPNGGTTGGDVFTVSGNCHGVVAVRLSSIGFPSQMRAFTTGGVYGNWITVTTGGWITLLTGLSAGTQFKLQAHNVGSTGANYTITGDVEY